MAIINLSGSSREIDPSTSASFTIEKDGAIFNPPYVEEVTIETAGETERITDQCGRTEERLTSRGLWDLDAVGLCMKPDLEVLKAMRLQEGTKVTLTSEPFSGQLIIKNLNIDQTDGSATAEFPNRKASNRTFEVAESRSAVFEGLVFGFEIQTRQPDDNSSGLFG
jgi:hypothetical protein